MKTSQLPDSGRQIDWIKQCNQFTVLDLPVGRKTMRHGVKSLIPHDSVTARARLLFEESSRGERP